MSKKKKALPPRCKRMNRERRLQAAKRWLQDYDGKNIVRSYRKHFGVDWICALVELKMLGIEVDPDYESRLKQTVENKIRSNRQRRLKKVQEEAEREEIESLKDHDAHFAYIAGYTPGGVPFGVTWEEMERFNEIESLSEIIEREEPERMARMMEMDEWLSYEAARRSKENGEEENNNWEGYEETAPGEDKEEA